METFIGTHGTKSLVTVISELKYFHFQDFLTYWGVILARGGRGLFTVKISILCHQKHSISSINYSGQSHLRKYLKINHCCVLGMITRRGWQQWRPWSTPTSIQWSRTMAECLTSAQVHLQEQVGQVVAPCLVQVVSLPHLSCHLLTLHCLPIVRPRECQVLCHQVSLLSVTTCRTDW